VDREEAVAEREEVMYWTPKYITIKRRISETQDGIPASLLAVAGVLESLVLLAFES
jgi:hypothetical protein